MFIAARQQIIKWIIVVVELIRISLVAYDVFHKQQQLLMKKKLIIIIYDAYSYMSRA